MLDLQASLDDAPALRSSLQSITVLSPNGHGLSDKGSHAGMDSLQVTLGLSLVSRDLDANIAQQVLSRTTALEKIAYYRDDCITTMEVTHTSVIGHCLGNEHLM